MSENYKLYRQQMAHLRRTRLDGHLNPQLREILQVVRECEKRWALEDWLDRQLD